MKFRILIVEDDKPQADRMSFLLKKKIEEDLDVTIAYGADKNISMKRFDIAIIDLNMPYLNADLSELDDNAGKYVINHLVNYNPDIFIIIRTAVSNIEIVANASNVAGKGCLKYIQKRVNGSQEEYKALIDEVKVQILGIKDKNPKRIDYGLLTYIHKESEDYEIDDWKSYRYDEVYVNGELINLPAGKQRAALYKYLVNKEQWLKDYAVLESVGYEVDGLYPENVTKKYKDNIGRNFQFLKDADLVLEPNYGNKEHRIILKAKKEKKDEKKLVC